ncbi:hypothetical protein CMUS01_07627 [Colletotrichum musicola]|uniref:Uncharacterized protein n=1 Tax=Colletotrichum musicola TaxID=2175873 RepID=A0A8H6KFX3_9PEZI|nr:hypothetical protein CMUS01_07627 [Colletotrichum musicola]
MLPRLSPEATIAIVGVIVTVAVALPQFIPAATRAVKAIQEWNRPNILPIYAHSPEAVVNTVVNLAAELLRVALSFPAHVDERLRAGFRITQGRLVQLQQFLQPRLPQLPRWEPWFIRLDARAAEDPANG